MAIEQTKPEVAAAVGIPLREFEAVVETIEELLRSGKYQVFLANDNVIRLIGEIDEFRVAFGKRLGGDSIDRKKAQDCMEELRTFLQVILANGKLVTAAGIFEKQVYDDDFEKIKDNPEGANELRAIIAKKLHLTSTKFATDALRERGKRLATIIGPVLEDLDIEIVSRRKNLAQGVEIDSPFLRVHLRYSHGGKTNYPFSIPPWVTDPPRELNSFDLECDETDIDLLINRLLQAKELLRNAIDAKIPNKNIEENK